MLRSFLKSVSLTYTASTTSGNGRFGRACFSTNVDPSKMRRIWYQWSGWVVRVVFFRKTFPWEIFDTTPIFRGNSWWIWYCHHFPACEAWFGDSLMAGFRDGFGKMLILRNGLWNSCDASLMYLVDQTSWKKDENRVFVCKISHFM